MSRQELLELQNEIIERQKRCDPEADRGNQPL